MLEWKRGGLTQEILDNNCVLGGGRNDPPEICTVSYKGDTKLDEWYNDDWYCVLPEFVVPKPATKTVVLEEWCTGVSEAVSAVTFVWRKSTSLSPVPAYWTKTGVTRELEVPNVE